MSARPLIPRIAFALLLLSFAATTLPRLVVLVDTARTLLPLPYEARRERQMGPWYASIRTIRREQPRREPVALIAAPLDVDSAVFANYYLYPIRTRLFVGRNSYRNAAQDPMLPKAIVAVTGERVERTAYDVLRDRDLRAGRRVVATPELSEPLTAFVLPLAASLDGPPPETFVIEATLLNTSGQPALVKATFFPKGMVRTITIAPGATAAYYDFVHQLFDVMDLGWMRVESTAPLRAAFYFANRGRGDATLLPDASQGATFVFPFQLHRDSKLFILNPYSIPTTATVDDEAIPLPPGALMVRPIASIPRLGGHAYAFVSTRELNGKTDFFWPSKLPSGSNP
ncbi:MAG TPA: hypothetical protein VNN08_14345 [Thermoanaerobaculia bacterium]|nr:hypothetical protein [Thermoanaerobaculia bacterium]